MAYRIVKNPLSEILKCLRNKEIKATLFRMLCSHSHEELREEASLPSEWYEKAYINLTNLSHLLKDVDLIDGRLVNIHNNHRIYDDGLEEQKRTFNSLAATFIGCPAIQDATMKNVIATGCELPKCFSRPGERKLIILNSLTKISNIINVSAQQRKLVRVSICPQVTQHNIWASTLIQLLTCVRSELEYLVKHRTNKELKMGHQIVTSCLKFLTIAISYEPESSSWMRVSPRKVLDLDSSTQKWEDVLEMFIDLINCLVDEKELMLEVTKLELMKEGLYQIRDILIDKSIGFKENRHQESLVQKKLTKTLGFSSRCLFTLLLYYLYGSVRDLEIDVCGGIYPIAGGKRFYVCMGKFLTSDEDKLVWNGVKQLDKALGLHKFVWESAKLKGELKLQGHLWCIGGRSRTFTYRGSTFLVHGIT